MASPTTTKQAEACTTSLPVVHALACSDQAKAYTAKRGQKPCSPSFSLRSHYLKMDVQSFFTSIDQNILYGLLTKKVKNQEILWLARTISFHDCARDVAPRVQSPPRLFDLLPKEKSLFKVEKGKGLPIGNLTSQFFANVYLNELDQFVKHRLKAAYYLRYVDDFLILDQNVEKLRYFQEVINRFLWEKLALGAHPKKQFIRPVGNGIDFVGYFVKPEYVLVRRRVVGQCRYQLAALGAADSAKRRACAGSYRSHFGFANGYGLIKKYGLGKTSFRLRPAKAGLRWTGKLALQICP